MPQRVSRWLSSDARWLSVGGALALTLLAGVMFGLVLSDRSRVTPVWLGALATALVGAVGCLAVIAVRDADRLWDIRKDAAIARGDAELAQRLADTFRADDRRSRELLQRLQVATTDAMRDPFLADRLSRGPRDGQDLLSLLDQVDRHLGQLPGAPRASAPGRSWDRKTTPWPLPPGISTLSRRAIVQGPDEYRLDQGQTSIRARPVAVCHASRDPRAFRVRNVLGSDPRNGMFGV